MYEAVALRAGLSTLEDEQNENLGMDWLTMLEERETRRPRPPTGDADA